MMKILRVGGSSISGELPPRGPALLPFRDFFSPSKIFGITHAAYSRVANFVPNKTIALSNA
jgi:hypothetical protein